MNDAPPLRQGGYYWESCEDIALKKSKARPAVLPEPIFDSSAMSSAHEKGTLQLHNSYNEVTALDLHYIHGNFRIKLLKGRFASYSVCGYDVR